MSTTTLRTYRTTAMIGDQPMSGVRCSNCAMTYARCTRKIMSLGQGACCQICADTDTHDTRQEATMTPTQRPARKSTRRPAQPASKKEQPINGNGKAEQRFELNVTEIAYLVEGLDSVETAASGFAKFVTGVLELETQDGAKVTAKYDSTDGGWKLLLMQKAVN